MSESPNTDTTLRAEGFSPPTTKGTEPSPESCSGLFSCGGTTGADYGGGWGSLCQIHPRESVYRDWPVTESGVE